MNVETAADYLAVYEPSLAESEVKVKQAFFNWSGAILGLERSARYRGRSYGETPALLHTESVRNLARFVGERSGQPWRLHLGRNLPWTEYTLYHLYLESQGLFEAVCEPCGPNTVLDWEHSIWHRPQDYGPPRSTEDWSPFANAERQDRGCFVVIQSWLPVEDWLPARFEAVEDFYAWVEGELTGQNSTDARRFRPGGQERSDREGEPVDRRGILTAFGG